MPQMVTCNKIANKAMTHPWNIIQLAGRQLLNIF